MEIEEMMFQNYKEKEDPEFDILNVIQFDVLADKLLLNMNVTTDEVKKFWTILKCDKYNGIKIQESSNKISNSIHLIHETYENLFCKLNFRNLEILTKYLIFLENIVFYEKECVKIKEMIVNIYEINKMNMIPQDAYKIVILLNHI